MKTRSFRPLGLFTPTGPRKIVVVLILTGFLSGQVMALRAMAESGVPLPFACGQIVAASTYKGGAHGADGADAVDMYLPSDAYTATYGTQLFAPADATVINVTGSNAADGSTVPVVVEMSFDETPYSMKVAHLIPGSLPKALRDFEGTPGPLRSLVRPKLGAGQLFGQAGWNGNLDPHAKTNSHAHIELFSGGARVRPITFDGVPIVARDGGASPSNPYTYKSTNCVGDALHYGLLDTVAAASDNPASFYVGSDAVRHPLPDVDTFWCMIDRVAAQRSTRANADPAKWRASESKRVPQQTISSVTTSGGAQPTCISIGRWEGWILRSPDAHAYVSRGGQLHSIVDGYTYECLIDRGVGVHNVADNTVLASAARGVDEPVCLSPARVVNTLLRAPDGTAYYVAPDRLTHWSPDGVTFLCRTNRGTPALNVSWTHIRSIPEGGWDACFDRNVFLDSVTRHVDGDAHYVDPFGSGSWIPDTATWLCRVNAQGKRVLTTLRRDYIDQLDTQHRWDYCLDINVLKNKILRHSAGDAHFIDNNGKRHWIATGSTYNCLVARGYQVIDTRWRQYVDSIPQVANATC